MKEILSKLARGKDLSAECMERAVGLLMDGRATEAQTGAFLAMLHTKGETVEELTAAVRAIRERAVQVEAGDPLVDTCGTGGDGRGTFNISTAASFVAAAAGARVAKHGNRAASGPVGAADVLEALGARIDLTAEQAAAVLESAGITFLFAPNFHPAFRHVAGVRRQLGFRTLFNLTGPLCNPAGASRQLIGLFARAWIRPIAEVLARLGCDHALVVHGADGSDEITTTDETHLVEVHGSSLREYTVGPSTFGFARARPEDLRGGDAAENAGIVRAVLEGRPGPHADIVALNAGAAIYVAGRASDLAEGVERARALLREGTGAERLHAFVEATQEVAP